MNMGSGQAAKALSEMLGAGVLRELPRADYWRPGTCLAALERSVGNRLDQVGMEFSGPVAGHAAILLEPELTVGLTELVMGEDPKTCDPADVIGMLEEMGNIILNATMGSLSNVVGMDLVYRIPKFVRLLAQNPMFAGEQPMVFTRTRMRLQGPDGPLPGALLVVVACRVPATFLRALDLFFRDDSVDRFLLPGEMVAANRPCVWSTVLGSCVSVCIRHTSQPYAAMNHFLLANADGRPDEGRFGDTSIRAIWHMLERFDPDPKHYRAHVFGGARMFEAQPFDIGGRNITVAREQLAALGIPVVEEKVGGTVGIHLRFDTATGELVCRSHKAA